MPYRRATIRSLRVLNALQTHVPAGSNEVPKLTELGLPAETTTDPFIRRAVARQENSRKAGSFIPSARTFKTTAGSWTTQSTATLALDRRLRVPSPPRTIGRRTWKKDDRRAYDVVTRSPGDTRP